MSRPLAKVLEVHDIGDDRLRVVGEVRGEPAEAFGWVSATTNHFPAKHYLRADKEGNRHLREGAKPRQMTKAEIRRYAHRLLLEQNPAAPTPTRIL